MSLTIIPQSLSRPIPEDLRSLSPSRPRPLIPSSDGMDNAFADAATATAAAPAASAPSAAAAAAAALHARPIRRKTQNEISHDIVHHTVSMLRGFFVAVAKSIHAPAR